LGEFIRIAGYCRISVDEELDRENTSIENQKAIIEEFVSKKFPDSQLSFYEDRDRSGYTFEQREGYQRMRPMLMNHLYDILVVKDFSRFARRNSRGLVELEDLRDQGVRIISIGDSIDYPTYDDWTAIQFRFLINEMPVTDTSKKVKSVIARRQNDGKWICAVPYGYIFSNSKQMTVEVDQTQAEVIRSIFDLYNSGWGYQKIANHLTELNLPTPRMVERERKEADGAEYRRSTRSQWSIVTVQGILENDFYIGTLRQGKYVRKKINGTNHKNEEANHIVFEHHHEPIVEYRVFQAAQEARKKRTKTNYRGVRKYDSAYSGFLYCGDCGSPMFSMSRADLKPAYTCGTYHRRGTAGCSSHHIRTDVLDHMMKHYISKVRDNCTDMLEQLDRALKQESTEVKANTETASLLERQLNDTYEELKATKRMRIRDMMKHPEKEDILEQTYQELEAELEEKISGLKNQIALHLNKRNTIIQVNRIARTAMDVFDEILHKEKLDKTDLELILDRILVYEDHIEICLKADIDHLLHSGEPLWSEDTVAAMAGRGNFANFKSGIAGSLQTRVIQTSTNRMDKVYDVNIISEGDPLEIYTDKEGGVIFKKYSQMGGLSEFAAQMCEALSKNTGLITVITDRDSCVAVAGAAKREMQDKRISSELEDIMERRQLYYFNAGDEPLSVCEEGEKYLIEAAVPILSEGDILGCVLFASMSAEMKSGETEHKLLLTAAGFLGRHMES